MKEASKKVLIFGRPFRESFSERFRMIMKRLGDHGASIFMYRDFHDFAEGKLGERIHVDGLFKTG